jgi:K+-sensing histidine kinase KdpD
MSGSGRRRRVSAAVAAAAAVGGPVAITGPLLRIGSSQPREYVFVYLGYVAIMGVLGGLWPALVAAAASFLLADYYFVPPVRTLTLIDEFDLVNLVVLFGTALLVGGLVSRRRRAQGRAVALAGELSLANAELQRLNREQAEAARIALELERTQRQVRVLEETDRARQELLANVSHELRTPLSSILTGSTALLGRADLAPARDELGSIAAEARRLGRLVGDMLEMARIEGGALGALGRGVRRTAAGGRRLGPARPDPRQPHRQRRPAGSAADAAEHRRRRCGWRGGDRRGRCRSRRACGDA